MKDLLTKARNISRRVFWPALIGTCFGYVIYHDSAISTRHMQALKHEQICFDEIQRLTKDDPRKKIVSSVVYDNELMQGHFAPDLPIKTCYCSTLDRFKAMLQEGFMTKMTTQTVKEKHHEKIEQKKGEKK